MVIEQVDPDSGRLRHLLTMQGLAPEIFLQLFARAELFRNADQATLRGKLKDRLIVNAFFEPSTRTSLSFEIAAHSLGAEVVNFDVRNSSVHGKGETVSDTLRVIEQLGADLIVIRYHGNLLDELAGRHSERTHYINGGDGCHAHPSQGLLDVWTVWQERGQLKGLKVAIIGDIRHSRVARSTGKAFRILGANVHVAGPPSLLPEVEEMESLDFEQHDEVELALESADVVVCLRIQFERLSKRSNLDLSDNEKLLSSYQINEERLKLAADDVLVLHPGPIHRGVEITSAVADGPHSCMLKQVANGVAMRMAIMDMLLNN